MNIIEELEKVRQSLSETVIAACDRLVEELENPSPESESKIIETPLTISLSTDPYIFIGKKPAAVLFDEERVETKSWRDVYKVVLTRCNENPKCHDMLMYLRGKTAGKSRIFLAESPNGMVRPVKIDEELYGEVQYGSQTLMHILCNRILDYTGFDYSGISIVIRGKR